MNEKEHIEITIQEIASYRTLFAKDTDIYKDLTITLKTLIENFISFGQIDKYKERYL